MPRYDYKCSDCGTITEIIHKMEVKWEHDCICGGKVERVFTTPALKFVGPGFHSTDYGVDNQNYDGLSHQQKDDYDKRKAEQYDKNEEKNEDNYKQNIRDITG